ncbi:carboxymuconolactone decarboxylase family protein [Microtetraspora sp. NBRC 16547]|uniref:carboxymuconolactone decarboxylase family protein n=1 Tax=Microtetraspora sp. NBRC 16547 TaxID=3030993 RepID=UPI0024A0117F|nr:carboxymuconolactone decarboxylase family protein [Microtetraspora sp. NBRC 16547]GLW98287.1 hypothetical protein Misp02_23740 [Microtetraspora sp. NBRC 16547]
MALLPYVTEDAASEDQARVIASVIAERGSLPGLMSLMAHSPDGLSAYETFSRYVRTGTSLDPQLRELIILRTVQLLGVDYEWKRHLRLAAATGVPDEALASLETWQSSPHFSGTTAEALRFVDRTVTGTDPRSAVGELSNFPAAQAVDIALVVGFYRLVSLVVLSMDLDADDRLPPAGIPLSTR